MMRSGVMEWGYAYSVVMRSVECFRIGIAGEKWMDTGVDITLGLHSRK
jgi:hypothetical protein